MSKYLKFVQIPFKGKTKRFEVVSKTSFEGCVDCKKTGRVRTGTEDVGIHVGCLTCFGTGVTPIILGRIQWYSKWRQYIFMPGYPTTWNRDCLNDIIFFINNLMKDRKILMMNNNDGSLPGRAGHDE